MSNMAPVLITDPMLLDVMKELMQREPIFHRSEFGTTRRDFERLAEAAFWEVGASGRRYSREYIIPPRNMCDETTLHIDRDATVVVCCDGIGCNASTKGALNMTKLGFRVKELIGGLDGWKRDGHKTEGGAEGPKATTCGCD